MTDGLTETQLDEDATTTRKIHHALGWADGKALCGADYDLGTKKAKPMKPDCVVCWDIWNGMDHVQRVLLWSRYV